MKTQIIAGLAVLAFLVAGWLVGTYFVAKQAKGTRERRFIIRAGMAVMLGLLAISAFDYFTIKIPGALVGIVIFLTLVILRRWQLQIRRAEHT